MPPWLTTKPVACVVLASISTRPPSAASVPVLLANACRSASVTRSWVRPSPWKSSVTVLPDASATVPCGASIVPRLLAVLPTSAITPPGAACRLPSLTTLAGAALPRVKL